MSDSSQICDIARRCMLRAPVVNVLDEVVVMDPVKRCIVIASAIAKTISADSPYSQVLSSVGPSGVIERLAGDAQSLDVMGRLKAEAFARRSGEDRPEMPALIVETMSARNVPKQRGGGRV